jgi:hypothetical protein
MTNDPKTIPISVNLSSSPEHSDDALELKFAKKHAHQFRYTLAHGRWNKWNGKLWLPDATPYVFAAARAICREDAKNCDRDLARKVTSASTVAGIERLARNDPNLLAEFDQWDANPWLLNTPTGVIDLHTGAVRPARPDDYMTKSTAVGPAVSNCPLWHKFLDKITDGNQKLQEYLQRMCGYALTGITAEHALFFLYGPGGNGKGRFVYPLAGILGTYAREAPIDVFLDSHNERHPTELAWLQGARLVTATGTEEGRRWSEPSGTSEGTMAFKAMHRVAKPEEQRRMDDYLKRIETELGALFDEPITPQEVASELMAAFDGISPVQQKQFRREVLQGQQRIAAMDEAERQRKQKAVTDSSNNRYRLAFMDRNRKC